MSEAQPEAELNKLPMIVTQVHESGPYAWYASKSMSDGYQYAAPGPTREAAIENLTAFLSGDAEAVRERLCIIAANKDSGPTYATYADDALGNKFRNGEHVQHAEGK